MKQPPPGLMTMAEYSRHRKVNRSHISRLAQRGILVMRGKFIDVAASDAVLDDKPVDVEPQQPAPASPSRPVPEPGQTGSSFAQAKTVEMVYRARLRKLEFEARERRLIDAEEVQKAIARAGRGVRDGLLGLPDRLAAILAAESDTKKVHATLKTELARELEALADAIDAI